MGNWIEVSLTVDNEGAEAVADVLRRYVHQGVSIQRAWDGDIWPEDVSASEETPVVVKAYIADDSEAASRRQQIEEGLYYLSRIYDKIPAPQFQVVNDEDWANAWKAHYRPVRIGKRLLIKPVWIDIEPEENDIILELDPGMAFGTGTHPTTQMCLIGCEEYVKQGMSVVDIGTGSGILAIAAAKLGASEVFGCDVDEVAVEAARENIERNGVGSSIVVVQKGSLADVSPVGKQYDLGLANLTARIIMEILPGDFGAIIKPGGRFIFSGIIDYQAEEVIEALRDQGLELETQRHMGDWVMLVMKRN